MEILSDIIQILILYVVIYSILRSARGSRFGQALMGVGMLMIILAACTYLFHFAVLAQIVRYLLIYLAISSVVIFQPEIRRMLTTVGAFGSFEKNRHTTKDGVITPEAFTDILFDLSAHRMGALFAVERGISLRSYEGTGVKVDARISRELVKCIFTPPLPLHDGGAVIRDGRLSSAHCIFPVSNNPDLIRSGMRHRAAVGLSEETDALVIVVSEERGTISVAHNGKLYRYDSSKSVGAVKRWVTKAFLGESRKKGLLHRISDSFQRLFFAPQTKGKKGAKQK